MASSPDKQEAAASMPPEAALREAFGKRAAPDRPIPLRRASDLGSQILLRDLQDEEQALRPSTDARKPLTPGERYQIFGEIARGGMGIVLKARDGDLCREVAVKMLQQKHESNAEVVQRFVDEAQIGGQLQHPGIVPVYDLSLAGDQRPYFTMKYVRGQTLAALLQQREDIVSERPRFLKIFAQVCQTIAYAHARGVVHRDIKPANVMVGAFGEVQVMDWGLSKILATGGVADERSAMQSMIAPVRTERSGSGRGSLAGSVIGTPAYMSPEQARGEIDEIDEHSDVFALGAILCEILTGQPPHVAASTRQILKFAARGDASAALARLEEADLDAPLLAIARRCLKTEPEERYRNGKHLALAVDRYLASVEARLREAQLEKARAQERAAGERRARRLTLALAATALVAVLGGGGSYLWWHGQRAARIARTEQTVSRALDEAVQLEGDAKRAGTPDAWRLAVAATARASSLVGAEPVSAAIMERLEAVRARLEAGERAAAERLEQQARDAAMLHQIDRARADAQGHLSLRVLAGDYENAFRDYGIDVPQLDEAEVVRRLREKEIHNVLIWALDGWAKAMTAVAQHPRGLTRNKLIAIAQAADDQAWRKPLRNAFHANDTPRVVEIVEERDISQQDPLTIELVGEFLGHTGQPEAAVALYRRGLDAHPDAYWLHYQLAHFLAEEIRPPQFEKALGHSKAALALRPDSADAWVGYGSTFATMVRVASGKDALKKLRIEIEAGRQAFEKALELDSEHLRAHINLGACLDWLGEPDAALEQYEHALQLPTAAEQAASIYYNIGVAHANKGNHEAALRAYREAIRAGDGPDDKRHVIASWVNLGVLFSKKQDPIAAIDAFEEALILAPENPSAMAMLGNQLRLLGRLDEALPYLESAAEKAPQFSDAWFNLGLGLADARKFDRALDAYAKAKRSGHSALECDCRIAGTLFDAGRLDRAQTAYEQLLETDPGHGHAWTGIATILLRRHDLASAVAWLRKGLESLPNDYSLQTTFGVALRLWGEQEAAIEQQTAALRADAAPSLAHFRLGNLYLVLGDAARAEEEFRQALEFAPGDYDARIDLGFALQERGRFAAALDEMRTAKEQTATKKLDYPWDKWIGDIERMAALTQSVTATSASLEADELPIAARAFHYVGRFSEAVNLWQRLIASSPVNAEQLRGAAASAMRASTSPNQTAQVATVLRTMALAWSRGAVELLEKDVAARTGPKRMAMLEPIGIWRVHSAFATVRGDTKLSADEAAAWRELWQRFDKLLAQARGE